MSSVLANLDASLPSGKAKTTDEKIKAIEDYLVQLLEQFRWTLNNLSSDNFNEKDIQDWISNGPINIAIQNAENEMSAEITASADEVKVELMKGYATAWDSNATYAKGDVIKNETTNTDGTQNVAFYCCTVGHAAALDKKPPTGAYWASYWTVLPAASVLPTQYSVIDQKADNIQLQVSGASAPEWTSGTVYVKDTVVKVTTAATSSTPKSIAYYKAMSNHTSSAGNKPPSSAWESTTAPNVNSMIDLSLDGLTLAYDNSNIGNNEHNGSYIKLMKDGTFIGGGKVFIKDLDASTITTGTLNAGEIVIDGEFSVVATENDQPVTCGTLGGYYNGGAGGLLLNVPNASHLDLTPNVVDLYWHTGNNNGWFRFQDDESEWCCSVPGHLFKAIYFDKDDEKIEVRCGSTSLTLEGGTIKIERWKNGSKTEYDLFDKLGQIT